MKFVAGVAPLVALLFFSVPRRMVLARTVRLCLRSVGSVLRAPYAVATIAKRRPKWNEQMTMPIAGIDALCGQSILFCLQRSVVDAKVCLGTRDRRGVVHCKQ